jgi:hypothetical protein
MQKLKKAIVTTPFLGRATLVVLRAKTAIGYFRG